jgi:putative lipoprotein
MLIKVSSRSLALAVMCFCGTASADDWFGRDKALHFGASAIIAGSAYGVTTAFDDRRVVAFAVGGGIGLGAGIAKEGYDALGYGDPSWKDLAWDVAGTLVGLGIAYGVDALLRREPSRTQTATTALVRF